MREEDVKMTGYPSIDKPWLKYYSEDAIRKKLMPNTIYGHLLENNKNYLDDVALIYFGRRITYKELFDKIESCKNSLVAMGIQAGDIVTIQTLAIPQTVILLYALSRIGAVANMIYVSNTEEEVNNTLKKTASRVYFVIDSIYSKYQMVLENTCVENIVLLSIDGDMDFLTQTIYRISSKKKVVKDCEKVYSWKSFMRLETSKKIADVKSDDFPVVIVYTGGTTGISKGVILSNRSINELVFQYEKANMGLVRQKIFMNSLPPFIAFGLSFSLHLPLCMGIKTVLVPDSTPQNQGKMFLKYKPNYFVAGPVQIEAIINYPQMEKADLSFIDILATGGDALPVSLERRINDFLKTHNCRTTVFQGYGMSELAATVVTGSPKIQRFGTVGIPLPNTNVKIVDTDKGEEVTYGKQGEICICAPSVMVEYHKEEEETAQIMKKHEDGLIWIHTGDIGTMDEDGFLTIVGRIKRMILVRESTGGTVYHKVFPKLLEEQIEAMNGVQAVAIVGFGTSADEQKLIAFIVASKDLATLEKEIREMAMIKFNDYERPVKYCFVDELPRTKINKVDYRSLENRAKEEIATCK